MQTFLAANKRYCARLPNLGKTASWWSSVFYVAGPPSIPSSTEQRVVHGTSINDEYRWDHDAEQLHVPLHIFYCSANKSHSLTSTQTDQICNHFRFLESNGERLQQHLQREQRYCRDNFHAIRALQVQLRNEMLDHCPDRVVSIPRISSVLRA